MSSVPPPSPFPYCDFPSFFGDSSPSSSSSCHADLHQPCSDEWTPHENKLFEMALAELDTDSPDLFENIASRVPGKTVQQIEKHYQMLVDDIELIDSGEFPIPEYVTSDGLIEEPNQNSHTTAATSKKKKQYNDDYQNPNSRKGQPWTEEEHRLFLMGLSSCGKGDWRSISRNFVMTRTPTQVASHAQKYFSRVNNPRIRRRSSIHDIRNLDPSGQRPILSANTNFIPIAPAPYPPSYYSSSSTSTPTALDYFINKSRAQNLISNGLFDRASASSTFMSSARGLPPMPPQPLNNPPPPNWCATNYDAAIPAMNYNGAVMNYHPPFGPEGTINQFNPSTPNTTVMNNQFYDPGVYPMPYDPAGYQMQYDPAGTYQMQYDPGHQMQYDPGYPVQYDPLNPPYTFPHQS